MPENILILADWRLAGLVDDTIPPRNPNGDDEEEEEDKEEEEISRLWSGNPNLTNNPQSLDLAPLM
jgi:hypothetical protein